jgi:hypothetical protein
MNPATTTNKPSKKGTITGGTTQLSISERIHMLASSA